MLGALHSRIIYNVALVLVDSAIADPNRGGALVARQVGQDPFGQLALIRNSVRDLEIVRVAGDSPKQPAPPLECLLVEAMGHHGFQCEGGITQPAVAVIPVAFTAE